MPSTLPERSSLPSLGTAMENLKHRWGWFVGLGCLAIALGACALVLDVHATIATIYIIAAFMIIAGGTEITVGVGSRTWGRFFLMIAAGLLYIVGGAFALAQPGHAAVILTLMLGAALLTAGAVRAYIGAHMHSHARTLVIIGGVVTSLVGLMIIAGWPGNSYVILGTLLGIDLLFTGMMWVGFGLRLKSRA